MQVRGHPWHSAHVKDKGFAHQGENSSCKGPGRTRLLNPRQGRLAGFPEADRDRELLYFCARDMKSLSFVPIRTCCCR